MPSPSWRPAVASSSRGRTRATGRWPVPADGGRREKIASMTQQMARVFEEGIAAHPEDWHMLQRVFAADFDPARPAEPAGLGEEMNVPVSGNGRGGDPA